MRTTFLQRVKSLFFNLRYFPVEVLLCVTFGVFYCFTVAGGVATANIEQLLILSPVFFVLVYCCNHLFGQRYRWIYWLSYAAFIPFIFFRVGDYLSQSGIMMSWVVAFLALLLVYGRTSNATYARDVADMVMRMVVAVVTSVFLYAIVAFIILSIEYIFSIDSAKGVEFSYLCAPVFFVFMPLLFCVQRPSAGNGQWTLRRPGKIILDYILSPAIVIYTVILYVYLVIILCRMELPLGGLAYMVMAFVIVSMVGRLLQHLLESRHYGWFYDNFRFIGLPLLALFWVGVVTRVGTYGLTEARVYLCLAGCMMTYYVVSMFFKRADNYRLMTGVTVAALALLTFVPGISARSIGIYSQEAMLEHYATRLHCWDSAAGRVNCPEDMQLSADETVAATHLVSSYDYLLTELGLEVSVQRWGDVDKLRVCIDYYEPHYAYYFLDGKPSGIDISPYNRYYSNVYYGSDYDAAGEYEYCYYDVDGTGYLKECRSDSVIYSFDIRSHLDSYSSMIREWRQFDRAGSIDPFIVKTDDVMLVFSTIEVKRDSVYTYSFKEAPELFIK